MITVWIKKFQNFRFLLKYIQSLDGDLKSVIYDYLP